MEEWEKGERGEGERGEGERGEGERGEGERGEGEREGGQREGGEREGGKRNHTQLGRYLSLAKPHYRAILTLVRILFVTFVPVIWSNLLPVLQRGGWNNTPSSFP